MRPALLVVLALLTTSCGLGPLAQPTATPQPPPPPTAAPAVAPSPSPRPATPTGAPAPKPTSTPESNASNTVWVGNTDGEGVYLRNTPVMSDRNGAYPDGTELTVIGDDVDGDGQHWKHVRTPDGLEGYVPSMYTTAESPQ